MPPWTARSAARSRRGLPTLRRNRAGPLRRHPRPSRGRRPLEGRIPRRRPSPLADCLLQQDLFVRGQLQWIRLYKLFATMHHFCVMCILLFTNTKRCSWGYRGPSCETKQQPTVRRNIRDISTKERAKFRRYMDRAKNTVSDFVFALEFKENIKGSHDFANISVYDYFVAVHYYASRETLPPSSTGICVEEKDCSLDFAHEGAGFPTWHRAFLLEAERALQEVNGDPDWTLPYWDWGAAEQHQCDICTNEYVGANDEHGNLGTESIFAAWRTICEHQVPFYNATHTNHTKPCDVTKPTGRLKRNPGHQDPNRFGPSMTRLPLATEVDFALRFPVFDTPPYSRTSNCNFRNLLEGFADTSTGKYRGDRTHEDGTLVPGAHTLHNHVHLYLNGTMSTGVITAANDPIFLLHHSNVDRLFETWIRRHGTADSAQPERGAPPGHNRHEYMVPFFPPYSHADMFKPSTELGYDYQELHGQGSRQTPCLIDLDSPDLLNNV
uniref:Tyrosinase n=1 Tax=Branchiostoma floridae TaxID=7739 RepID=Q8T777_BRAFL|nr:unknown [Branchiostoma floridae]